MKIVIKLVIVLYIFISSVLSYAESTDYNSVIEKELDRAQTSLPLEATDQPDNTVTNEASEPTSETPSALTNEAISSPTPNLESKKITLTNLKVADVIETLNQMKSLVGKIDYHDHDPDITLTDTSERIQAMEAWIKQMDIPLSTEIFQLKNIKMDDIMNNIQAILTKTIGHAQPDTRSNSIVVTDTQEKISEVEKLIKDLDQDNKSTVFQVKVMQIILNEEHQKGIDWEAIVSNFQSIDFAGFDFKEGKKPVKLDFGTLSQDDYQVLLGALDTVGVPHIISDSQKAINVNEPLDLVVRSTDVSMTAMNIASNPEPRKDERIKLSLNPAFNSDEKVFNVKIKTKLVTPEDMDQDLKQNEAVLKVQDGATIVVGGVSKNVLVESTRKIPLLGDLPFFGFAFRNQGQRLLKTEVIVFLTPKLIVQDKTAENSAKDTNVKP